MNNQYLIGNAILWAAAILASAILHAPIALSIIFLPLLAISSLGIIDSREIDRACEKPR